MNKDFVIEIQLINSVGKLGERLKSNKKQISAKVISSKRDNVSKILYMPSKTALKWCRQNHLFLKLCISYAT